MPRAARSAEGGVVYHVFNGANSRDPLFRKEQDYADFIELLSEGKKHARVDVFGFCLMPDHWNLVLRPRGDGDLSKYLSWVSNTHVKRYRAQHPKTSGHLYQGRYKSFPVKPDEHLLAVLRFVETSPLRAKIVKKAERWRWSSAGASALEEAAGLCSSLPVKRPRKWLVFVNESVEGTELDSLQTSLKRDRPYGPALWVQRTADRMGLLHTLRPRGRPALVKKK